MASTIQERRSQLGQLGKLLRDQGQTSHQKVREAEENTIKMALKYDKHPRAEIESVFAENFEKRLKRYKDLGVRDFSVGVDVVIQYEWVKKFGELTRKALEKI